MVGVNSFQPLRGQFLTAVTNAVQGHRSRAGQDNCRRPGWRVPIIHRTISNDPATREMLVGQVRRMHWQTAAKLSVGIASVAWWTRPEEAKHQNELAARLVQPLLYGPAITRRLQQGPPAILFTRESLLTVFRIALVEMSDGTSALDATSDAFTRAILLANELLSDEINPPKITNSAADLLASELRSIVQQRPPVHEAIARSDAFIRWLDSETAKASSERLPVREDFVRFTGLELDEYLASVYLVLSRNVGMPNWDAVDRMGIAFELTQWLQGITDSRCAGDGLYCVPSPQLLMNKFGEGFYFTIFDGYRGEPTEKGREKHLQFSQFWSEFFEDYVFERFRDGYAEHPEIIVHPEILYLSCRKSSDVIIVENGDIIFVEVVAKHLNMRGSVTKLDDSVLQNDFRMGIAEKIEQLDRNIKDFRSGVLLADIPRKIGYRVFPVIVSPNEWPRIFLLNNFLPDLQAKHGWLQDTEPLELLDIAEVERIEAIVAAGYSFSGLLDRKNKLRRHERLQSLHNYLANVEPNLQSKSSPTRERGKDKPQGRFFDIVTIGNSFGNQRIELAVFLKTLHDFTKGLQLIEET
jgi:hypothetical protein